MDASPGYDAPTYSGQVMEAVWGSAMWHIDEKMIDVIESAGIDKAAEYFMALHRNQLPIGVLEPPWRDHLPDEIYRNVLAEIRRYPCTDKGRQLYLFLLINDQRRHLYKHFESIDEHGLEFLTPFFDSVFLRTVAATPVTAGDCCTASTRTGLPICRSLRRPHHGRHTPDMWNARSNARKT